MNAKEQAAAAKAFAEKWKDRGDEKSDTQVFWIELLRKVYEVENAEDYIQFESRVKIEKFTQEGDDTSKGAIDAAIPATKIIIEQKSLGKNLAKAGVQSSGDLLTPYAQAKRYADSLPNSKKPRWIVTCNFAEFRVYDMETEAPETKPQIVLLENLASEYDRLQFLVDKTAAPKPPEEKISLKAGDIIGRLKDALKKQYKDPESAKAKESLNKLCVRLVFCLYAEDADLFDLRNMFHDYLATFQPQNVRLALIELFKALATPLADRDPYMNDNLAAFPYVNGGLFEDEDIEIPNFNDEILDILLHHASDDFDWSLISPPIFGALFESTLSDDVRRAGGMHYTSRENIHKVIDPLFLDDLKAEFEKIKAGKQPNMKRKDLLAFQKKLASLVFLDPAAGSGNFLTETYLSLRRLENEILKELLAITASKDRVKGAKGSYLNLTGGDDAPIQVGINQFYGIEINDYAVAVAQTALWIAESQMMKETEEVLGEEIEFLPLKTNPNIVCGNALTMDWGEVVPRDKLNYIMGNPPFVGHQWRSEAQTHDMQTAFYDLPKHGKLDYVCAWYNKAADYIKGTQIQAAFVSTNSIVQGESVGILWKFLFEAKNVEIFFAHRPFVWISESKDQAAVHCVIIGFDCQKATRQKRLFSGEQEQIAENINGYLLNAPSLFIQARGASLTKGMPKMSKGSQPTDDGALILSPEERNEIVARYPQAEKWIRRYISGRDYIQNVVRYCLWLKGASPAEYRKVPPILERLERVAAFRQKSPTASVRRDAETPMLFTQIRQPSTIYLAVPEVSSERRRYIPIGYLLPEVIGSNKLYIIPDADLYLFGVLISNVHMAWMRIVAGRLEMRYSYSPAVYNNFPWPTPTTAQRAKIKQTAQGILDARADFPDASLADLYDKNAMPPELRKAHKANDKAVMAAYGFKPNMEEAEIVAELMKMYQDLTKE